MTVKIGDFALCSRGELGLVTSSKSELVTYADGSTGRTWTGIHVGKEKLGDLWCSRNPIPLEINILELFPAKDVEDLFHDLRDGGE